MATAQDVIGIATGEIGTTRIPEDHTKYGTWYGVDGVPWCAIFVNWVFAHAGCPLPTASAYVPAIGDYAQSKGLARPSADCQPGDQICFDWNGGDGAQPSNGAMTHTAIVESRTGGTITFIGGNQDAVGHVSRGTVAVGHPQIWLTINWQGLFDGHPAALPDPPAPDPWDTGNTGVFRREPTIGQGLANPGPAVADWRDALSIAYRTGLSGPNGNGTWDDTLQRMTRKFQGRDFGHGLSVDGQVGDATWGKMGVVLARGGHWFTPRVR